VSAAMPGGPTFLPDLMENVLLSKGRKFEEPMTYLKSILVGIAVASLLVPGSSIASYLRQEFAWGSVVSVEVGSSQP
jgi:hypothetical protein